ncbi:potassium uptake TrkH family protein [Glaciihabitans tibetensis]|uniref:Potassium uptake TrkH family protein n=1 Tax=Glaciihabitans tibetensis TaxID=1266600 RepID=A0A2T0VJ63_9MICO|nr:potassium transporter TrkG [Glaciihabitans tibetensis]PRY70266.1 potassium uptake TrkH family protein [Glaciihabitans tibetensis]
MPHTPLVPLQRVKSSGLHAAQLVVTGFAAAVLIGTVLLLLPISKSGPGGASFIEALFTATSAVCVTGHIIVDTPVYWSSFGQVVILALIQVGGLGIMIFASLIGITLARKMSIRGRVTAAAEARSVGMADIAGMIRGIVVITVVIEAAVFLALTLRFWLGYGYQLGDSVWYGLFHAVSAFNNAGFSTFSDNLVGFATDPWICLPIALAIILGGLGFPVIMQLRKEFRRPLHWSMNTKLVLVGTGSLLAIGTALTCWIEWSNTATLGEMSPADRILAGFFHTVQTRTAGFNSLPIGEMNSETWFVSDILMFIGAGPAGTAGGIKVTTFLVLFFIMYTELRGEGAVNIFGKRLSRAVHRQAITIVLASVAAVVVATGAIMLLTDFELDRVLFEVISAFATVGLSTGITADLPVPAQLILVALMFLGRLGPLTLGTAIALKQRRTLYEFPKERPVIG